MKCIRWQAWIIVICVIMVTSFSVFSTLAAQLTSPVPPFFLTYSPDGSKIAGSADGLLRIWDANSGSVLVDFPSMRVNYVNIVVWSPDSKHIATTSGDQFIRVWNVADPNYTPGQLLYESQPFWEGIDVITGVSWKGGGQFLAAGGISDGASLKVWDTTNNYALVGQFAVGWVEQLSWHPDVNNNEILIAGSNGGPVIASLVFPRSSTISSVVGTRNIPAQAMAWNSDGSKIAVGYEDGSVYVWDRNTNLPLAVMSGTDQNRITQIAWSPDNNRIAAANGVVRVWNSSTGELISTLPGVSLAVDFSNDGNKLVYSDGPGEIQVVPAPTSTHTNQPPVTNAGTDQTIIDTDNNGSEDVTLDGSTSSDDGTITSYVWTENGTQIATGATAQVTLSVGVHTITLTVTDDDGATDTDEVTITVQAAPTSFPATGVLDDFNRADGSLGENWYGNTANYSIVNQQAQVNSSSGSIAWTGNAFSANQEAFVTLTSINPASAEIDLLLKAQLNDAMIEVLYHPAAAVVGVLTYAAEQGWVLRGEVIPVSFAAGDQFGARALADGTVEVYQNGTLLAERDVSAWPYNLLGGCIGLWFENATGSRLDDFGGGDVTAPMPPLYTYQVSASADDVNEADGGLDPDRTILWIGNAGSTLPGYAGLRFSSVTIPQGALIQSAHLQVFTPYNQWISLDFTLVGEAADTSAPFSASALPSQRVQTAAQVPYQSSANWVGLNWYSLGEIAPIIQEIVSRPGWQSGNSLSLLLQGVGNENWGRKFITAFDDSAQYAPRLIISYTVDTEG